MSKKSKYSAPVQLKPSQAEVEPARGVAPVGADAAELPELDPHANDGEVASVDGGTPSARPTFEDFLAARKREASFEVVAVAPYLGHYVGAGVSISPEPRVFTVAQLFTLEGSYLRDLILADSRVNVRILG